jgi:UPF0716 protein FxsA
VRFLFLLFIIVPVLEMWVLIQVGTQIGALATIGLVLLTAVIGINLLRQQGISTLWRAQQRMNSGEMPVQEMVEGLLLAIGGALLLTPGFMTDAIGFCCLLPGIRQLFVARLAKHFILAQSRQSAGFQADFSQRTDTQHTFQQGGHKDSNETIDGDFERHDP